MNKIIRCGKPYAGSLLVFLLAALVSACGGDSSSGSRLGGGGESPAIASLAVTSTAPADGAAGVGANVKVVAVFNKDMDAATLDGSSFTLTGASEPAIVGAVSYSAATRTASLDPGGNLSDSTLYTATITTAVEDVSGNSLLNDHVWTFTSGAGTDVTVPTVSATTPNDGETDVVRNAKVTVTFSEAVDPETITPANVSLNDDDAAALVPSSLQYVNPTTVVLTPDADLAANHAHTLTLSGAITDIAANPLTLVNVSFTTGAAVSSSPAPVDLGTAANYVILAKTGISTTGTTAITGDIAVSPEAQTALTGFGETLSVDGTFATSPLVTGKLFAADMTSPTPVTLTTAVGDMETAYANAAGRVNPDFTELGAGEIGGMTLDPGLYAWGTSVQVTTDVTLNGDSNDVWIFQVAQDFKVQDGSQIVLTGGAQPENVFWQVGGEVTLQAGSTFNGIALSQTAMILKSGATVNGRMLVQTATTLIANDVNAP